MQGIGIMGGGVKFTFNAISSELFEIKTSYCTCPWYKLVLLIKKTILMVCMSFKLEFNPTKLQK